MAVTVGPKDKASVQVSVITSDDVGEGDEQAAMISALIAIALLAQQVSAPVAVKARVEGRVINSLNGEAVRKATVILRAHDEEHGQSYADETDGDGHFSIDDVEPGEYAVLAERPGFALQTTAQPAPRHPASTWKTVSS